MSAIVAASLDAESDTVSPYQPIDGAMLLFRFAAIIATGHPTFGNKILAKDYSMNTQAQIEDPQQDVKSRIVDFMQGFTIETTPGSAKKVEDFRDYLREGTWVYVTSLPGADFADTADTCKKLADQGMQPVPHFTARGIKDAKQLEENLAQVCGEAGVKRVLALAGADKTAVGDFVDTMSMLETSLFDKYGIQSIGVAGHPEGSPDIEYAQQRVHGLRKNAFSQTTDAKLYLVTQFVFEAQPIIDWVERSYMGGNRLPVIVGIPGLATLKSLIGHAKACGIGASMAVLMKQAKNISKLLTLQEPDKLVRDLANYNAAHPESLIEGVHMYPLGGLARSAIWSYAAAEGNIELNAEGFKAKVEIK